MYAETFSNQQDDLITNHAPLVKRIAYHMIARLPASVLVDDLIQAGMIGLLDAARQYDATQGASFETYATIRIRGSMIDELRRNDWAPKSVHKKARDLAEAIKIIEDRTGRDAQDKEVAEQMGISLDEYYAILKDTSTSKLFSVEELGLDNDSYSGMAHGNDNPLEEVEDSHFNEHLAAAIETLPERERQVLAMYYDEEFNLREIGEVFGVSESRISQILSQTHARLRARMSDWLQD